MWMLTMSLLAPAQAEEPAPAADCSAIEDAAAKEACMTAQAEKEMAEAKAALEALGDCATKEGDAKTQCETDKAALEAKLAPKDEAAEAPAEEGKSGKAQRSNTNRMEQDAAEE